MLKYFVPLLFSLSSFSQGNHEDTEPEIETFIEKTGEHKYVSLKNNKVFDIEIIVFAYLNPLPDYKTFSNKFIFDDSQALSLSFKPKDLPYIQDETDISENPHDSNLGSETNGIDASKPKFTVPIGDEEENSHVLAWFEHEQEYFKLVPIWKRLVQQQNIVPLLHKAWRQTETPFKNPTYVKLSNVTTEKPENIVYSEIENNLFTSDIRSNNPFSDNDTMIIEKPSYIKNSVSKLNSISDNFNILQNFMTMQENYSENPDSIEISPLLYSDFTVTGMVALSKGRFMHFGHKINLFRLYQDIDQENKIKNMVFSLIERKELGTGELHYFDSPWFGSIVKITEYKGQPHENN